MFLSRADDRRSRAAGIQIARRFCILILVISFNWRYPYSQNDLLISSITVASKGHNSAVVYDKDAAVGL
jgi:hypothetical protein